MTYKLLIFDWDGTIIDSIKRIVDCFHLSFDRVGLPRPEAEAIKQRIGLPLRDGFEHLAPDDAGQDVIDALAQAYRDYWRGDVLPLSSLFGGTSDMIKSLSQHYDLAVATGKSRVGLERELNEHQLGAYFGQTRCAEETHAKPHPEMLQEILAAFGYTADQALMIGDTTMDIDMAHNAGMDGAAVTTGGHGREQLQASQPKFILDRVTDLPDVL